MRGRRPRRSQNWETPGERAQTGRVWGPLKWEEWKVLSRNHKARGDLTRFFKKSPFLFTISVIC